MKSVFALTCAAISCVFLVYAFTSTFTPAPASVSNVSKSSKSTTVSTSAPSASKPAVWIADFEVEAISSSTIELRWKKVPGAKSYEVWVGTGGPEKLLADEVDSSSFSTDDCVSRRDIYMPGAHYIFSVKVVWE